MNEYLDPRQRQVVQFILSRINDGQKRIFIGMPVGSGKTTILLHAVDEYLKTKKGKSSRILIVFYNRRAVDYTLSYLRKDADNKLVAGEIGKVSDAPVQVATFHNLSTTFKRNGSLNTFDLVLLDEVDDYMNFSASGEKSWAEQIFKQFSGSTVVGFGSGFVKPNPFFGQADYVYTLQSAVRDGYLLPIMISRVRLSEQFKASRRDEDLKVLASEDSPEFLKALTSSIQNIIKGEKTLVICRRVTLADPLISAFNAEQNNSSYSAALFSNMDSIEVNGIINKFEKSQLPLIIVTTPNYLKGLEFKAVRNVVLLDKIRNPAEMKVVLSRTMRTSEGKEHLHVIDYAENDFRDFGDINNQGIQNAIDEVTGQNSSKTYINETKLKFKKKGSVDGVLGVMDLADEMAGIIRNMPDDQGAMIGIFGKWGRGKTFLMEQTWNLLKNERYYRVDYHAWKYQDTPASWAYLYENLSEKFSSLETGRTIKSRIRKARKTIQLNIKRKGKLPVFKFLFLAFAGLASAIAYYLLSEKIEVIKNTRYIGPLAAMLLTAYKISKDLKKEYSSQAKDLFLKYSQRHSLKEQLGLQAEIQKEVHDLLEIWIPDSSHQKVLLFIDDLDRCDESKIIQVIDSLRVMLEDDRISKRIVVVTAIDERILKRAIKSKYRASLSSGYNDNDREIILNQITGEYIDKIFLVGIKLGDLSYMERQEFFLALIKDEIEEEKVKIEVENPDKYNETTEQSSNEIEEEPNFEQEEVSLDVRKIQESNIAYKLSREEVDILLNSLEKFVNTTPRQICIFYYRYLITKNLLVRQYARLQRENIWLLPENTKLYIDLIIAYSLQEDHSLINEHKVNVLQSRAPECAVFLLKDVSFSTKEYGELLKVLDMVLAY